MSHRILQFSHLVSAVAAMPPIYDIYERKNYRNRIPMAHAVSFELEVGKPKLHIQAESDLSARAKDRFSVIATKLRC